MPLLLPEVQSSFRRSYQDTAGRPIFETSFRVTLQAELEQRLDLFSHGYCAKTNSGPGR